MIKTDFNEHICKKNSEKKVHKGCFTFTLKTKSVAARSLQAPTQQAAGVGSALFLPSTQSPWPVSTALQTQVFPATRKQRIPMKPFISQNDTNCKKAISTNLYGNGLRVLRPTTQCMYKVFNSFTTETINYI